jgi:hypothetical protein
MSKTPRQAGAVNLTPNTDGGWLPMPHAGRVKRLFEKEWREYHERRARHHAARSDYTRRFGRPTSGTAEKIWTQLTSIRKLRLGDLLPDYDWLKPNEIAELEIGAQQALAVAVDAAILAGQRGRMLTTNAVFDALAAHWSDHYRRTRETTPATCSWEMRRDTLRAAWRDLLRNGIRLDALLPIVQRGFAGLYATKRVDKRGFTVTLSEEAREPTRLLAELIATLDADPEYRCAPRSERRLLLVDEPSADGDGADVGEGDGADAEDRGAEENGDYAAKVAAEWKYNIAVPGPGSIDIIRRLEAARLFIHVPTVVEEYDRMRTREAEICDTLWNQHKVDVTLSNIKPRGGRGRSARQWGMKHLRQRDVPTVKKLVAEYDTLYGQLNQLQATRNHLRELNADGKVDAEGHIKVKSGFYKLVNRRYQSAHFWPTEVTGKDVIVEREPAPERPSSVAGEPGHLYGSGLTTTTSRRGRFFRVAETGLEHTFDDEYYFTDDFAGHTRPLVGVDVSASQFQILAAFLGIDKLEAQLAERAFKEILAERAWERHTDPTDPFKLPGGSTLATAYTGPKDSRLIAAVKAGPSKHVYGSKLSTVAHDLRDSPEDYGTGLGNAANIGLLLDDPQLHLAGIMSWLLPVCHAIADRAVAQDPYMGVTLTEPFDNADVRWNPVRWVGDRAAGTDSVRVRAKIPTGKPNAQGEYPVDPQKLRNMVAPCLIHMLDGTFAGFVIKALNDGGVKDVVSLHDCWLISSDAAPALFEAVRAAGEPWLRALGPVYDDLERYVGNHPKYGPWLRNVRQRWRNRVNARRWPKFRVSPVTLYELGITGRI